MASAGLICGVDIGSTTSKAALVNEDGELVATTLLDTLNDRRLSALNTIESLCEKAGISQSEVGTFASTGYGRRCYEGFDVNYPEVLCHARGTEFLHPGARSIIDVGGQDSKVIEVERGAVLHFEMNDKCAAGTGRFYEVLAKRLFMCDIDELGALALKSEKPAMLSSMCTVFVESEIVSLLSSGVSKEDIARGVLVAQAKRIRGMAASAHVQMQGPIILSGGLANNCAAPAVFGEVFATSVEPVSMPQMTGAIGAALLALEE